MSRLLLISGFVLTILLIVPIQAQARHGRVLGTEADNLQVDLATTQGPGLLMPSSPLYFIDLWRDNFTLFLSSFDKEAQAKLHLKIAGERISEVKMTLEGKEVNARGLDIALSSITENINGAASSLKAQKNKGKNVEKLAGELNNIIDAQQISLRVIAKAHGDEVRLKIKAVQKAIDTDEIEIEDELSEDELDREVEDELEEQIEDERKEASSSAVKVDELEKELKRRGKDDSTSGSDNNDSNSGSSDSFGSSGSGSSGSGKSGKD